MIIDLLAGAVRGGTSIMYAGLGETISERAGIINLGTEGSMLLGSVATPSRRTPGTPGSGSSAGRSSARSSAWCAPSWSSAAGPTSSRAD